MISETHNFAMRGFSRAQHPALAEPTLHLALSTSSALDTLHFRRSRLLTIVVVSLLLMINESSSSGIQLTPGDDWQQAIQVSPICSKIFWWVVQSALTIIRFKIQGWNLQTTLGPSCIAFWGFEFGCREREKTSCHQCGSTQNEEPSLPFWSS